MEEVAPRVAVFRQIAQEGARDQPTPHAVRCRLCGGGTEPPPSRRPCGVLSTFSSLFQGIARRAVKIARGGMVKDLRTAAIGRKSRRRYSQAAIDCDHGVWSEEIHSARRDSLCATLTREYRSVAENGFNRILTGADADGPPRPHDPDHSAGRRHGAGGRDRPPRRPVHDALLAAHPEDGGGGGHQGARGGARSRAR